uniref:Protein NUCLEAR FUSION DEFECTIVE 4-like n=1 Tax=Nelumbo nucifera TaxID=4432 RepID=A0A822YI19_NELNU|nr:TPA_asm: hypothetical protein HUJ06_009972 [Nelumbo nucifera]
METSKWIATVASIWIQCTSGASYTFGIYSPVLKSSQGYDQSTLDSIAVFKDIGANVGLLSGLLYDAVAVRPRSSASSPSSWINSFGGPWIVHVAGAIQCFTGYFSMWLSVTGILHRPPVPLMCLFMFLAAHSQTFFNTANVVTAVQNFPNYSGTIVGIMKGFLGLSGAILIQVYEAMYKAIHYTNGADDKKNLNGFSLVALNIAAYLMVMIILENITTFELWARVLAFVALLLLLASPFIIAIRAQLRDMPRSSQTMGLEGSRPMDETGLLEEEKYHEMPSDTDQESYIHDKRIMPGGEGLNLLQAMCTINFWIIFLAMACGMGSGLATVNNISQIGGSLGYTTVERSTLVSLWSIWNFLGRFGAGYISDYFLHLRGLARPLFMAITLAAMSIGHAIIASGLPGALYAGSILVGVCYGSQWSLMPTIASELFGVLHMGTIFNTISIASPIGSYILSVRVVGYIYDKEASGSGNTCSGAHCFMLSFLIMASVSLLGFLVALGLFFRTRRFYKEVIYRTVQNSSSQ